MKLHVQKSSIAMIRILVALCIIAAVGAVASAQPTPITKAPTIKKKPPQPSPCAVLKKQVANQLVEIIKGRVRAFASQNRTDIESEIEKAIKASRERKEPKTVWIEKTEKVVVERITDYFILQFDLAEKNSIGREISKLVTDLSGNERIGERNADLRTKCGERDLIPTDKEIADEIKIAVDDHVPTIITPEITKVIERGYPEPAKDPVENSNSPTDLNPDPSDSPANVNPVNANTDKPINTNTAAVSNVDTNSANAETKRSPENVGSSAPIKTQKTPSEESNDWIPYVAAAAVLIGLFMSTFLANNIYRRVRYGQNAANNLRGYKNAVSAKNELVKKWMEKRRSANIHAIGVGFIPGTSDYCVQVFVEDASAQMLEDPPTRLLPPEFRNLPIVIFEMPRAEFLNADAKVARSAANVLYGGVSGANANLQGEFGTIGYFFRPNLFRRAQKAFLQNHVYLLSNAHVFTDLSRETADDSDLIMQPSPGDHPAGRAVATLHDSVPLDFSGDIERPNYVDAAIARLGRGVPYSLEIARIGAVKGFLRRDSVVLTTACRKFGRTTGLTNGAIFSIHLSIWVKYPARGAEALFSEQFLILPADGNAFVKPGDSGSLLVDDQNRGIGLIFAGANAKTAMTPNPEVQVIGSYGVANSLSEVMKKFGMKI